MSPFEDVAFNQPIVCSSATWNEDAETFADVSSVGLKPYGLFVNVNNSVYVAGRSSKSIFVYSEENATFATNISTDPFVPFTVFTTSDDYVYASNIDSNANSSEVSQWDENTTSWITVWSVQGRCENFFIDVYANIYCSMNDLHQVTRRLFTDELNVTTIIAGNGTIGSSPDMLSFPRGIFVTRTLNLYVADCRNDRVQLFQSGQRNATTLVTTGISTLNCPTGIVLDSNGYLFFTDTNGNRIIGSGPTGYRCVAGCNGTAGVGLNQLNSPRGLSFDRDGNIYVVDTDENRIQKFILATNSCG